jgi:hypothetical protein
LLVGADAVGSTTTMTNTTTTTVRAAAAATPPPSATAQAAALACLGDNMSAFAVTPPELANAGGAVARVEADLSGAAAAVRGTAGAAASTPCAGRERGVREACRKAGLPT